MSEEQTLKTCRRCNTENRMEHNFCWLCGIGMNEQLPSREPGVQYPVQRNRSSVGASVGAGIFGVLAGAMGGIAIGILIVVAFILAILNAIGEMFDGCAAMLLLLSMTASAALYTMISWLF